MTFRLIWIIVKFGGRFCRDIMGQFPKRLTRLQRTNVCFCGPFKVIQAVKCIGHVLLQDSKRHDFP